MRESSPREIIEHCGNCRRRLAPFHSSEYVEVPVPIRILMARKLQMLWQISSASAGRNIGNPFFVDRGNPNFDVIVKIGMLRKAC
jgi:hypothetical protein